MLVIFLLNRHNMPIESKVNGSSCIALYLRIIQRHLHFAYYVYSHLEIGVSHM